MLTPIEIHNKQHKQGRGYSKKEMDEFLEEMAGDYESLYKENRELKEKLEKLSDGIQYYKSMESTLQKALVLAEKTSKDTIDSANKQAELIEKEARFKASQIISRGKDSYETIRQQCMSLIQQYNQFKLQFKQIAIKQIELFDSDFYEIYTNDFMAKLNESIDNTDMNSINEDSSTESEKNDDISTESEKNDDNSAESEKNDEISAESEKNDDNSAESDVNIVSGDTKKIPELTNKEDIHEATLSEIIPSEENIKKAAFEHDEVKKVNDEDEEESFIRELRNELSANVSEVEDAGSAFEFLDSDNI